MSVFLYSNLATQIGRVSYGTTHNLISLHTCYSVGTYDLDKVKGSITFKVCEENERYEGIGRGSINLENLSVFEEDANK